MCWIMRIIKGVQTLVKDLNHLYKTHPALFTMILNIMVLNGLIAMMFSNPSSVTGVKMNMKI